MVSTQGGRDMLTKEEADIYGPQHTLGLGLGGLPWGGWGNWGGWGHGGTLPWLGLGLGNLFTLLGGLPWLGHPGGYGGLFPWKKQDLGNDMKGYIPTDEGGAFNQSP